MTLEFLVRPEYMISKNDNKSIIFHIIMTIQAIVFNGKQINYDTN